MSANTRWPRRVARTVSLLGLWLVVAGCTGTERRIRLADYQDKVYAAWLGQCIGNMYGLSHEWKYKDEPRTDPIPGWMPDALERIRQANGAFSDDDTDIEYVLLACMDGYDADNQCATLAGLVGVMHGTRAIPRQYTHVLPGWTAPLNDFYKNLTRDEMPDASITAMSQRTAEVGRRLVCLRGGRVAKSFGGPVLVINSAARFVPPLEVRLFPAVIETGTPATINVEVIGGNPSAGVDVILVGTLPPGLRTQRQHGRCVLTGTPTRAGPYEIVATVFDGARPRETRLPILVRKRGQTRPATGSS